MSGKYTNSWGQNNSLWNDAWVKEDIKKETKYSGIEQQLKHHFNKSSTGTH